MRIDTVVLELTSKCNQNCLYCSVGEKQNGELDFMAWTAIIDKLATYRPMRIILSGGEPMIMPYFWNIYKYCLKRFQCVGITTNGTYINERDMREFEKYKPNSIQISIDGSKEYHDMMRGNGTYELAINAIRKLIRRGVTVYTMSVITKKNIKGIPLFIEDMNRLGVSSIGFERISPIGYAKEHSELLLDSEDMKLLYKYMNDERNNNITYKCNDPIINSISLDSSVKTYLPINGCMAGIKNFAIDSMGFLKICTRVPLRIGKFIDINMNTLYTEYEWLRKIAIRDFEGKCKKCHKIMLCGGCRADAYGLTGNVLGEDKCCFLN